MSFWLEIECHQVVFQVLVNVYVAVQPICLLGSDVAFAPDHVHLRDTSTMHVSVYINGIWNGTSARHLQ